MELLLHWLPLGGRAAVLQKLIMFLVGQCYIADARTRSNTSNRLYQRNQSPPETIQAELLIFLFCLCRLLSLLFYMMNASKMMHAEVLDWLLLQQSSRPLRIRKKRRGQLAAAWSPGGCCASKASLADRFRVRLE